MLLSILADLNNAVVWMVSILYLISNASSPFFFENLQRVKTPRNEYPRYDTKLPDSVAPVLVLWRTWSTPLFSLLHGPVWPGVVAPDWALSMGQIELFDI